jgi:uncharacterized protein
MARVLFYAGLGRWLRAWTSHGDLSDQGAPFMNLMQFAAPLAGGLLIGLSAILLLVANGRVLGVSGIVNGLFLNGAPGERGWRMAFVAGMIVAGLVMANLLPGSIAPTPLRSLGATAAAGVIVGVGTQLGSGCTSGHGVCGIGRGSKRSIIATITFMTTGILTVTLIRHLLGGTL